MSSGPCNQPPSRLAENHREGLGPPEYGLENSPPPKKKALVKVFGYVLLEEGLWEQNSGGVTEPKSVEMVFTGAAVCRGQGVRIVGGCWWLAPHSYSWPGSSDSLKAITRS